MAFPKLKAPTLIKNKKTRKRVLIVTSITTVAVVAVIVLLYYTNRSFRRRIDELLKIGDVAKLGPIVDTADNVTFEIPEDRVPPNSEFVVVGEFTDKDNKPVRVKQAFYYIIQNASGESGPRELITQGTIGTNVNKFSQVISTSGFPRGNDYDVIVSDHALSVSDIQGTGMNPQDVAGPGVSEGIIPLGIGKGEQSSKQSIIGGVGGVI